MTQEEYEAAIEAHRVASRKFAPMSKQYHARQIGDAEFLAARSEYQDALKAFDRAEAAYLCQVIGLVPESLSHHTT